MLDAFNNFSLRVCDAILLWALGLPSDLALLIVGIGTATLMILVRPLVTNQERLRRAAADTRRLGELIKQAKSRRDKPAVHRHRFVKSMVAMLKLRSEGRPLLVAIVPIAILATWAMARLAYHPPRSGQEVVLIAYVPLTNQGDVCHLVPQEGIDAVGGWVQSIVGTTENGRPEGKATWRLVHRSGNPDRTLTIRLGDRALQRRLLVGGRTYASPVEDHGGGVLTQWDLKPVKLLGVVGGLDSIGLPPWLIAYLLIVIPFVLIIRKVTRIH